MSTTSIAAGAAKSSIRKWVLGALAVGIVTTAAGAGTFASFSASTANPDNVFSTGRIELSNTKESGTACLSGHTGTVAQASLDSNDNAACSTLIDLDLSSPGDTTEGHVALANTGDYDGLLQFFVPTPGCANSTVVTPAGNGNLCGKLEVYIQETQSNYTTAKPGCVFPYHVTTVCSTTFAATGDTLTNLATTAAPSAPQPATPIGLDMGAAATRYFVVRVNFADAGFDTATGIGLDNAYQNRAASFGLTWRLQEA